MLVDKYGISCFVGQNGATCFIDQNGARSWALKRYAVALQLIDSFG
jgi:hypothetical protein